ncbi:hypothetical protein [Acinetobacter sp. Ac_5812]|uniref:hypothetical protein n=1 Tax=Acinetobacter sp. Ac_5812 TaxID=1848937 RepID=UPI00148F88C9|nr:hypothetical protein [Acinetobacter sp. Ac_5812]NNP70542.1 hypothetical protein [Acinetobacter sp. Ac_5812]
MKYSILSVLVGSLILVGCGGDSSDNSTKPTPDIKNPEKPVQQIKKISGQVEGYQDFKSKFAEILSADGKIYKAEITSKGQYSISDEIKYPYVIRVEKNDNTYLYGVPKDDNRLDVLNINKISNLLTLTLSPNNLAENLWGLESKTRVDIIVKNYKAASQKIDNSISPVLSVLNATSIDVLNQPYEINRSIIDNILDNINVVVNKPISNQGSPVIALAAAATPNNVTLWDNSLLTKNPILLSSSNNIFDFGAVENSAEKHYEEIKASALKYDPKNIDQNKVRALSEKIQQELQNSNPSTDKIYSLLRDFMIATAVPVSVADEIIRSSKSGESIDKIADLIGKAYGQDLSKEIEKYKDMKVDLISKDAVNKKITYKITLGGIPQIVTWSVSGQVLDSSNMNKKDMSSCIQDVYSGSASGPITPEYYVRNSIFKNTCNQDLNYISCIWVGGTSGKSYCKDTVSKLVKSGSSTGLYNITAGPLIESRVFFACPSPSVPTFVGDNDAFIYRYRCS